MTTIAARAKLEKELYPPITQLLEADGLHVWEEATIRAGDEGTRTADHVAWRWEGDEIDALAVEVKPGAADIGLAQAVAYSAGFDSVFVAAEEPLGSTGYLASVFERLGLGYICVSPTDAQIQRKPERRPFTVEAVRAENLARVRLKHLFADDIVGERVRFGADRRGDNWVVTGTTSAWQLCGQVTTGSEATALSLLAESKAVGDRAAANLDSTTLGEAVSSLAQPAEIVLRQRRHDGFKGKYSDVLRRWTPADGRDQLDDLLSTARSLSAPRVGPHFEIQTELWPHAVALTEARARQEFQETLARLRAVRSVLNERL
jgi:hypothetical protein